MCICFNPGFNVRCVALRCVAAPAQLTSFRPCVLVSVQCALRCVWVASKLNMYLKSLISWKSVRPCLRVRLRFSSNVFDPACRVRCIHVKSINSIRWIYSVYIHILFSSMRCGAVQTCRVNQFDSMGNDQRSAVSDQRSAVGVVRYCTYLWSYTCVCVWSREGEEGERGGRGNGEGGGGGEGGCAFVCKVCTYTGVDGWMGEKSWVGGGIGQSP